MKQNIYLNQSDHILCCFGELIARNLEEEGIGAQNASNIALKVMDVMSFEFGGQNVYFPKGIYLKNDQKALEILDKFNQGATISEIAFEYKHSVQHIYNLIAKGRALRKNHRQEQETEKNS